MRVRGRETCSKFSCVNLHYSLGADQICKLLTNPQFVLTLSGVKLRPENTQQSAIQQTQVKVIHLESRLY